MYSPSQWYNRGPRERSRLTSVLPAHSNSSAVQEKLHGRQHSRTSSWFIPVSVAIPGNRRLRIAFPNPARLRPVNVTRLGRKRATLLCVGLVVFVFVVCAFFQIFGSSGRWPAKLPGDTTLVFEKEDLKRIWKWEIESGHYPSTRESKYFTEFLACFI